MTHDNFNKSSNQVMLLLLGVLSFLFGIMMGMVWCETSRITNIFDKDYNLEAYDMGYVYNTSADGVDYSILQFVFGGITQLLFLIAAILFFLGRRRIIKSANYKTARKACGVMIAALIFYMITCHSMNDADELPIFDQIFYTLDIPGIRADNYLTCELFEYLIPNILVFITLFWWFKLKFSSDTISSASTQPPVQNQFPVPSSTRQTPNQASANATVAPSVSNQPSADAPSQTSDANVDSAAPRNNGNVARTSLDIICPTHENASGSEPPLSTNQDGKPRKIRKIRIDDGKYVGEVYKNAQGKIVPHGVGTWDNRSEHYEGCWADGSRHGTGNVWVKNGPIIMGEWDNGVMNGWFCYIYKDGFQAGPMVHGEKHGTWYDKDGDYTFWNHGNVVPTYDDVEPIIEENAVTKSATEDNPAVTETQPSVSKNDNVLAGLIPGMEFASAENTNNDSEDDEEFDVNSLTSKSKDPEPDETVQSAGNKTTSNVAESGNVAAPHVPDNHELAPPSVIIPVSEAQKSGSAEMNSDESVSEVPSEKIRSAYDDSLDNKILESQSETLKVDSAEANEAIDETEPSKNLIFAFCPFCGKKLGESFDFCPYCGKLLEVKNDHRYIR